MILKKALSERLWNTALEEQLEGEGTEGGQKLVEQRYFNSHAWPQTTKIRTVPAVALLQAPRADAQKRPRTPASRSGPTS